MPLPRLERYSAEQLASAIFEPRQPRGITRLWGLFSEKARIPAYPSLKQAIRHLESDGLSGADADCLVILAQNFMSEKLPDFVFAQIMKQPVDKIAEGMVINDIHWSTRHYLGVAIRSPQIDLQSDKVFIEHCRHQFTRILRAHMDDHPRHFLKRPAYTGQRNYGLSPIG